jgi:hypothetical protein
VYAAMHPQARLARPMRNARAMNHASLAVWVSSALVLSLAGAALAISTATSRLHERTNDEARAMLVKAGGDASVVRAEELEPLPVPVRRWLTRAGVVGRPRAQTVRLRQRGAMHTSPGGAWFAVSAEQAFRADEPAFVWWMKGRVLPLAGRDKLVDGEAEMHITAGGLKDVALARGPKVDQGALLRWLAEIIWFPSAALRPFLVWQPIDDTHANVTITDHGISADATFTIDPEGRVAAMDALRYYGADGWLERWGGRMTEWKRIRGVEIPTRGEVVWHLERGAFTFFRWRILDVETNVGASHPSGAGGAS